MVWWLFQKKREDISSHPHLKKIEGALKSSFNNIKGDISSITSHIHKHKGHITEINKKLEQLEKNIVYLHGKLEKESVKKEEDMELAEEEYSEDNKEKILNNLTTVQTSILRRLAHLQTETDESWVSTKNLTEDLYPEKEYSKIRPMMSDYLNILLDFGLINKVRKRRQTYVSLSTKAINLIPKSKQKKLIKIIERH